MRLVVCPGFPWGGVRAFWPCVRWLSVASIRSGVPAFPWAPVFPSTRPPPPSRLRWGLLRCSLRGRRLGVGFGFPARPGCLRSQSGRPGCLVGTARREEFDLIRPSMGLAGTARHAVFCSFHPPRLNRIGFEDWLRSGRTVWWELSDWRLSAPPISTLYSVCTGDSVGNACQKTAWH